MSDDKVVVVLSHAFDQAVTKSNSRALYEATDRHGLLEWAAQVYQPAPTGYETVVNLAMWDSSPDEIALSSSVAQIANTGDKAVKDFVLRVALEEGYDAIARAASALLDSAIMFARENPQPPIRVGAGPLFEFASSPEGTGAHHGGYGRSSVPMNPPRPALGPLLSQPVSGAAYPTDWKRERR